MMDRWDGGVVDNVPGERLMEVELVSKLRSHGIEIHKLPGGQSAPFGQMPCLAYSPEHSEG